MIRIPRQIPKETYSSESRTHKLACQERLGHWPQSCLRHLLLESFITLLKKSKNGEGYAPVRVKIIQAQKYPSFLSLPICLRRHPPGLPSQDRIKISDLENDSAIWVHHLPEIHQSFHQSSFTQNMR
jgi:hypothetical protein